MPLPLTISCFSVIQIGFTFLVQAHPGSPGQRAVKRVCVCVCVWRTAAGRIPKQVFFGQLSSGKRPQCGPVRRYKDTVKANIKRCGLRPQSLSTAPFDRAPHASWPPCHLRSRGLPSWTRNGQLASSRSSPPPARFGRATDAAGPTHHGLGSLRTHR